MHKPHLVGPGHAASFQALLQRIGGTISLRMAAEAMSAETLATKTALPVERVLEILTGRDEKLDLNTMAIIADALHAKWNVYLDQAQVHGSRGPDAA